MAHEEAPAKVGSNAELERMRFDAWWRARGTPPILEHPQAFDAWMAAKADKEDEDAIKADTYDTLADLLEPYMERDGRHGGFLPPSVCEAVQILLDTVLRSNHTYPTSDV